MGEAVAGYLMERVFGAHLHHRPRGRGPDIYMRLPTDRGATVEAKASVRLGAETQHSKLAEALFDMLTIWAHIDSVQRLEELDGFCVGVAIGRARVEARILRLEFRTRDGRSMARLRDFELANLALWCLDFEKASDLYHGMVGEFGEKLVS